MGLRAHSPAAIFVPKPALLYYQQRAFAKRAQARPEIPSRYAIEDQQSGSYASLPPLHQGGSDGKNEAAAGSGGSDGKNEGIAE